MGGCWSLCSPRHPTLTLLSGGSAYKRIRFVNGNVVGHILLVLSIVQTKVVPNMEMEMPYLVTNKPLSYCMHTKFSTSYFNDPYLLPVSVY